VNRVLFVCVENACRSQLAEAIANAKFGDYLQAFSAGSNPAKTINPKAINSLARKGIVLKNKKPKNVLAYEGQDFEFCVTMGCGDACPAFLSAETIDWNIPDPKHMNDSEFDQIRDLIEKKIIEDLIR
jgi:protein-tyrosine-phosphatase|tara:strand:+ start:163 stop:546 length:384 start_codon:yes stop_codon:yes gene_type:complete